MVVCFLGVSVSREAEKGIILEPPKTAGDGSGNEGFIAMIISSTLLALNLAKNLDELENAEVYSICVIQDDPPVAIMSEIHCDLKTRNLGKVLPIVQRDDELAFSIVFEDLDSGIKAVKRRLWESGLLLSSKLVLVSPEIRMIKDYGEGM